MPAPLRILLTPEEDRTLSELREAQKLPQRIRDRAHMLRLNALGWNVPEIAEIFECHQHTVRATLRRWQEQGLYIFFLPPYCSEMNLIESQWNQLKTHEIAGRMFDNEYDLAMAVIDGMKARSEVNGYALERFIFNYA